MFIKKESRQKGQSQWLGKCIEDIAKSSGCKTLTTTINTFGKIDVTRSLKTVLAFGFEFIESREGYLLFKKDLKK